MVKRPSRENPKEQKPVADISDHESLPRKRRCRKASEDVTWVADRTLVIDNPSDDDDSTYVDEEEQTSGGMTFNINVDGKSNVKIEIEPRDEQGEEYESFLSELLESQACIKKPKRKTSKDITPTINLTEKETKYFKSLTRAKQREYTLLMKSVSELTTADNEVPLKFQILSLPISEYMKGTVIKKLSMLEEECGEAYKLRSWIDSFMKIPFGKIIPLPVKLDDGRDKCASFMKESRQIMDKAVFGMDTAKTQILQVLAQWVTNPNSIGNVIVLHGPAGTGKTSLSRNGISKALRRPFEFFSLGGASDLANYIGHSYTYEGSMWGRIVDSLMKAKCMNPVIYFDELDKVSGTAHGDEITNMLIHLTDRSQNTQFHDRYFAGVDLDVSQSLFVFSCNDLSLINPILRDRMQVIHCSGYTEIEKQTILKDYVWPQLIERLRFSKDDIVFTDQSMRFLIAEYSSNEQGVRTLIRIVETIVTRLNMLRIADEEMMKGYKFYIKLELPVVLNEINIKKLLCDESKSIDTWQTMYN